MNRKLFAFFIFAGFPVILFGQFNSIRFKHFDISNGISSNTTNAIFRDSKGFMWFGTTLGLNRYDGYSFKVFNPIQNDTCSISSDIINCIAEDRQGNLWIGTEYGLNKFDPVTEKFTRYNRSLSPNSLNYDYITDILVDKDNKIWIGTGGGGINIYNSQSDQFSQIDKSLIKNVDRADIINKMAIDDSGNIFILFEDGYFCYYHSVTRKFELLEKFESNSPFPKQEQIFINKNDAVWIGYSRYTYIYNINSRTYYKLHDQGKVFSAAVVGITEDEQGNIWVGTTDKGLNIFNNSGTELLYSIGVDETRADPIIIGSGINRLYTDYSGIIWLASNDGGLCYYKNNLFKFQSFEHNRLISNSISNSIVNVIFQSEDGCIYIGTENGLNIFHHNSNTFQKVISAGIGPILSISEDTEHNIVVSNYIGQVFIGRQDQFRIINVFNQGEKSHSVIAMNQDSSGNCWFGTMGEGVFMKKNIRNEIFKPPDYSLSSNFVTCIKTDSHQNVWVGTSYGLNKFTPENSKWKKYISNNNIIFRHVNTVYEDSDKRIWIGFHNGLALYLNEQDSFLIIDKTKGLINEQIMGIVEDNQRNLWITTANGLFRLSFIKNDLSDIKIKAFYTNDGLPDNLYRRNSVCRLKTGEILVGSVGGLGIVNPSIIDEPDLISEVSLTGLRVFNKPVNCGDIINGRILLDSSIILSKNIELSYRENFFSLEFSSLPFTNPDKWIYQYRLEGFSDSWIPTNSDMRIATFTNIKPDEYVFQVRASADGEYWGPVKEIRIEIQPPFWKNNWAKVFYAFTAIFILVLLRYTIRMNEHTRMRIKMEKEEAKQLHYLDMMKINMFTNISHEIRTPLSLIITPLEKLISEIKSKEYEKPLQTIQRNTHRLLQLVNQLLDFRKLEAYGLEYYPFAGDIISCSRGIADSFNDLAEGKDIKYTFSTNTDELIMQFDYDKYEKIIYNLLSNAFKFTPERGSIALDLNYQKSNGLDIIDKNQTIIKPDELIIKVSDTGIGIPENLLSRIFDKYVQAGSVPGSLNFGTGIGLSLVYEYVQMHKGNIIAESEEGKGSCFKVSIPVEWSSSIQNTVPNTLNLKDHKNLPGFEEVHNAEAVEKEKPLLLIIEDNEELRFYLKDNLKKRFRILEASNGIAGWDIAIVSIPDIIISDIMMPEMDGITLCRKLKKEGNTSHIPVILLTAMSSDSSKLEGIETGADDYIVKPFNFKILEARIKMLLQKQKKLQQRFASKISVSPKEIAITSLDEQFLSKAFSLMEQNMDNASYNVEDFSKDMAMSRSLLYKKLMPLTGKAPSDFIRTMRLKRAYQLLMQSQLNISEIALQVGFNDAKYFGQCFKKEFDILPSELSSKSTKRSKSG